MFPGTSSTGFCEYKQVPFFSHVANMMQKDLSVYMYMYS